MADSSVICKYPAHPYTQALISAIPSVDPDLRKARILLEGDIPSPMHPPLGCRFHPRCLRKMEICGNETPDMREIQTNHYVSCHSV